MIFDWVCHSVIIYCRVILYVWCSSPVFSLSPNEYLGIFYLLVLSSPDVIAVLNLPFMLR